MSYMQWNEKFSVGIQSIDDQHRQLVSMVNELHDAMRERKGNDALKGVLSRLIQYTKLHFTNEEAMMKKHDYPDYQSHKSSHSMLTEKVMDLELDFNKGRIALSIQVYNFLKEWLTKHILGEDKKYAPFLAGKGIT